MKKIFLSLAVSLIGFTCLNAASPLRCLPLRDVSASTSAFSAGESLVYLCHYKWGPINADVARGYVTVSKTKLNGTGALECKIYGKTAKFYDPFFKVREDFRCTLADSDLRPLRYTRDTKEGGYYAKDRYDYIWDGAPRIVASLNSKSRGERSAQFDMDGCTFDFMSLLFLMRNVDADRLRKGHPYHVSFALGADVDKISILFEGKEKVKVSGLGTVSALKFSVRLGLDSEQFNSGAKMYMWLSDDANRVPVLFEAPIKVGVVRGRLESYSGLKAEFSALEGASKPAQDNVGQQ